MGAGAGAVGGALASDDGNRMQGALTGGAVGGAIGAMGGHFIGGSKPPVSAPVKAVTPKSAPVNQLQTGTAPPQKLLTGNVASGETSAASGVAHDGFMPPVEEIKNPSSTYYNYDNSVPRPQWLGNSRSEARRAYNDAVSKHHPDKLPQGLSPEEIAKHDQEFKRFSAEYNHWKNKMGMVKMSAFWSELEMIIHAASR